MSTRDLTIVMPVRDGARFIATAIESALAGADGLLELLVVDDGSTDDSARIAAAFGEPVRVLPGPARGPAAARNVGIAAARGGLIGFLDCDDRWLGGRPDPRRAALDADPGLVGCGGHVRVVARRGGSGPWLQVRTPVRSVVVGAWLWRPEVFARVGPLAEEHVHAEDIDFLSRVADAGVRHTWVDEVVLEYRLRGDSLSRDRDASNAGVLAVLRQSMLRKRATEAQG